MQSGDSRALSTEVKVVQLPFVPRHLQVGDIREFVTDPITGQTHFFWHETEARKTILQEFAQEGETHNKARDRFERYHTLAYDGQPYSLYRGINCHRAAGAGTWGIVKYALNLKTGKLDVGKFFSVLHNEEAKQPMRERSVATISRIAHQDFAELKKANKIIGDKTQPEFRISEKKGHQIYFFMALEKGLELFDYLDKDYFMSPRKRIMLARQICEKVEALHQNKKIHRDLKLENIMLDPSTGEVVIVDLDTMIDQLESDSEAEVVRYVSKTKPNGQVVKEIEACGSVQYAAPEVHEDGRYSKKSDIYAVGQVLAKIFRFNQYHGEHFFIPLVAQGTPNHYIQDQAIVDRLLKLLEAMLFVEPAMRPSLPFIIERLKLIEADVTDPIKIAIFNVTHLNYLSKTERPGYYALFSQYDEVQLISNNPSISLRTYVNVTRHLELNQVNVRRTVYTGTNIPDIEAAVQADCEVRYPGVKKVYAGLAPKVSAPATAVADHSFLAVPRMKRSASYEPRDEQNELRPRKI